MTTLEPKEYANFKKNGTRNYSEKFIITFVIASAPLISIFETLSLSCGKNILSCLYASIQTRDFLFQKGKKREGCHVVWNIFTIHIVTIMVYLSLKICVYSFRALFVVFRFFFFSRPLFIPLKGGNLT